MTYAVTGATGGFGAHAVNHLISQGVPASSIVALARDEAKAADLKAKGVVVRIADYNDGAALTAALKGVDRLLLVSGSDVSHRLAHHKNVIQAAQKAGVKRVVYTSLTQAATSGNPLAPDHKATEEALKASGLEVVIVRNNWYIENYAGDVAGARQSGVVAAAVSTGRVASAPRSEYAEAAVRALTGEGHGGITYELGGSLWTYQEFAAAVAEALGQPVKFVTITEAEKKAALVGFGVPDPVAGFFAAVDTSIEAGSLAYASSDLEKLLGRKPATLAQQVKSLVG